MSAKLLTRGTQLLGGVAASVFVGLVGVGLLVVWPVAALLDLAARRSNYRRFVAEWHGPKDCLIILTPPGKSLEYINRHWIPRLTVEPVVLEVDYARLTENSTESAIRRLSGTKAAWPVIVRLSRGKIVSHLHLSKEFTLAENGNFEKLRAAEARLFGRPIADGQDVSKRERD